jgi:hypothetical protein
MYSGRHRECVTKFISEFALLRIFQGMHALLLVYTGMGITNVTVCYW